MFNVYHSLSPNKTCCFSYFSEIKTLKGQNQISAKQIDFHPIYIIHLFFADGTGMVACVRVHVGVLAKPELWQWIQNNLVCETDMIDCVLLFISILFFISKLQPEGILCTHMRFLCFTYGIHLKHIYCSCFTLRSMCLIEINLCSYMSLLFFSS